MLRPTFTLLIPLYHEDLCLSFSIHYFSIGWLVLLGSLNTYVNAFKPARSVVLLLMTISSNIIFIIELRITLYL